MEPLRLRQPADPHRRGEHHPREPDPGPQDRRPRLRADRGAGHTDRRAGRRVRRPHRQQLPGELDRARLRGHLGHRRLRRALLRGQRPAGRRGGLDRARRARRPRPHGQRRPDRAQRARCVHHVPGAGAGRERRWHQRMVGHRRGHHLQRADRHHPGQQPRSARNGDLHHGFIDQQRSRRGIHHRHRSRGLSAERPEPLALGAGP